MAFQLKKAESERRDRHAEELRKLASELQDAISEYNEKEKALRVPVEEALAEYNAELNDARGFIEDIANEARGEWDDKSEKWQESDKGQAVNDWIDALDSCELEDIEVPFNDDVTLDEPDHADNLDGINIEPEDTD